MSRCLLLRYKKYPGVVVANGENDAFFEFLGCQIVGEVVEDVVHLDLGLLQAQRMQINRNDDLFGEAALLRCKCSIGVNHEEDHTLVVDLRDQIDIGIGRRNRRDNFLGLQDVMYQIEFPGVLRVAIFNRTLSASECSNEVGGKYD